MARPVSIKDDALLERLSRTFREVGYDGASVAVLAAATGLRKASLYHRFPGGKEQMARDVLSAAEAWLREHVIAPLESEGSADTRIAAVTQALERFYDGGRLSCLVNVLSSDFGCSGPFAEQVRGLAEGLISALSQALRGAGLAPSEADLKAEQVLSDLQGSLILTRVLGRTDPFDHFLQRLRQLQG